MLTVPQFDAARTTILGAATDAVALALLLGDVVRTTNADIPVLEAAFKKVEAGLQKARDQLQPLPDAAPEVTPAPAETGGAGSAPPAPQETTKKKRGPRAPKTPTPAQ